MTKPPYPGEKFFHERNANIRNCDKFAEDVEFIHACHIEGALDSACRQVFERRAQEIAELCARHVETKWSTMVGRDLLAAELRKIGDT